MKCKFCGREVHREKYLSANKDDVTCGQCTEYCTKKCNLGKSGKVQGWHFEPCINCQNNPYNKRTKTEREKEK